MPLAINLSLNGRQGPPPGVARSEVKKLESFLLGRIPGAERRSGSTVRFGRTFFQRIRIPIRKDTWLFFSQNYRIETLGRWIHIYIYHYGLTLRNIEPLELQVGIVTMGWTSIIKPTTARDIKNHQNWNPAKRTSCPFAIFALFSFSFGVLQETLSFSL